MRSCDKKEYDSLINKDDHSLPYSGNLSYFAAEKEQNSFASEGEIDGNYINSLNWHSTPNKIRKYQNYQTPEDRGMLFESDQKLSAGLGLEMG